MMGSSQRAATFANKTRRAQESSSSGRADKMTGKPPLERQIARQDEYRQPQQIAKQHIRKHQRHKVRRPSCSPKATPAKARHHRCGLAGQARGHVVAKGKGSGQLREKAGHHEHRVRPAVQPWGEGRTRHVLMEGIVGAPYNQKGNGRRLYGNGSTNGPDRSTGDARSSHPPHPPPGSPPFLPESDIANRESGLWPSDALRRRETPRYPQG